MPVATPGWQTEELLEEWVESSPSPPPATLPKSFPSKSLPRNVDSVHAKRGSLRGLGHAPARGLPTSRSASSASASDNAKMMAKRDLSGLLSPPSSRSSSEDVENRPVQQETGTVAVAGTFLVKDGVDDDRGKHLLRNQAKSKDIFGALPLERMFLPPSPPTVTAQAMPSQPLPPAPVPATAPAPASAASPPVASPPLPETHNRRISHQYAPANPSRLCKSITPSNCSSSFTNSADPSNALASENRANESLGDVEDDSIFQDDTAPQAEYTTEVHAHPLAQSTTPQHSPAREDQSPTIPHSEFSFTYEPPSQATHNQSVPAFDPSEISHSTVHGGRYAEQSAQSQGLRLFRSTYDTYTREHLSALVDSIAIEPSGSLSPSRRDDSRDQSPQSGEASGSRGSGSTSESASDLRSSKRLRMSPESPPGRTGMMDWGARGMMLMDKIRTAAPESMTSASRSRTTDEDGSRGNDPSVEYQSSPTPPLDLVPSTKPGRQTHRSNPSTTSSGYLRRAEDLMAKIKNRVVSESGSNSDSPAARIRQALSETDDNAFASSEADSESLGHNSKGKAKAKARTGPSPRRILRRLSASEEIKRIAEESSESEDQDESRTNSISNSNSVSAGRSGSGSESAQNALDDENQNQNQDYGAPFTVPRHDYNADDLNRYVSSSTYPTNTNTGTTISTSFVKHSGRPPPPPSTMRMIRPADVADLMPERVGGLRYDKVSMRWVKDALGTVDENGESRRESEESEDVFAGMESWRDEVRSLRQDLDNEAAKQTRLDTEDHQDSSDKLEQRDDEADQTRQWSDSDTSPIRESSPAPQLYPNPPSISPPARPLPVHANSAPPALTLTPRPGAGSSSPPKQLRSALRQPNSSTPFNGGLKKKAGWHADLTPAHARADSKTPGSSKRSVSFSDGKKAGKIVHSDSRDKWVAADEFFGTRQEKRAEEGDISWTPAASARTKRIQGVLNEMEDLSLDDAATPSKPPKQDMSTHTLQTFDDVEGHQEDDTAPIVPFGRHSTRSRANETMGQGNATFLTECSFGVAHDKLVQLITDVQPFEPYWETLKSIDLRSRSVDSLARLKEFLPKLEEVLLDGNRLSYLSGLPSSILSLHASNNKLSSLTSVAHLRRIEVLDISNNQIDSVFQLECLKNLKELKADGNTITDISGIANLDGLVKLSVANNRIESLDVGRTKWTSLEDLNVSDNRITEVRGLEKLENLRNLNLDDNRLTEIRAAKPMTTVRTLRIDDNEISSLDMSNFPKLRTLYADGNRIPRLSRSGVESSRLENLSMRNQRCSSLRLSKSELSPIKRLYVSGNALPAEFFSSPLPCLLYLEAAACSLSTLPANLSTILPNLRVLNLNYNFLSSLSGLANMPTLRKLTVVGCRLGEREKGLVKALRGLTSLEELDLRMNPSTLSFYLPLFSASPAPSAQNGDMTTAIPDKSYIQPTTRLNASSNRRAMDRQAQTQGLGLKNGSNPPEWSELDGQFRRSLPDEWYGRRLLYRGLVMRACPEVEKLDGLEIGEGERRKARELMDRAGV